MVEGISNPEEAFSESGKFELWQPGRIRETEINAQKLHKMGRSKVNLSHNNLGPSGWGPDEPEFDQLYRGPVDWVLITCC